MKKKQNIEILYGIHSVREALKACRRDFHEVYIAKEKGPKRLIQAEESARQWGIPVKKISSSQLKLKTATDFHQGIGAKVGPYPLVDFSDIADKKNPSGSSLFLLLLDNIVDPQNLGALIRTGECIGIDGILITKNRSASPTPAVSRASAGALEHAHLCRVTNMVSAIKLLKEKGVWIAGMDKKADTSMYNMDLTLSLAVIIGGEGKGLRPLVKENCDFLVSIPQTGQVNSLNASVAGAVFMYEAFRQRTSQKKDNN